MENLGRSLAHNALDVICDFRKSFYGELPLGPRGSHAKKAATVERVNALQGDGGKSE